MTNIMIESPICGLTRTSTKDQDGESTLFALKGYAERNGFTFQEIYFDRGYSGCNTDRPAYQRMLEDMRTGKFKTLIVPKLDRLGRSIANLVDLMGELKNKKIRLISLGDGVDTAQDDPMTRAFWQMLGVFAELEAEMIRMRVKAGHEVAKANGQHIGRPKGSGDKRKRSVSGYQLRYKGTTPEQRKLGKRGI
jgi:DNA invertase Pin-like site-specific DNA recombinase